MKGGFCCCLLQGKSYKHNIRKLKRENIKSAVLVEWLEIIKKGLHLCKPLISLAPGEGFEPPTGWLTATCSAG